MNFDNTISIYMRVNAHDSFEEAAQTAFGLICKAQVRYPDWPRVMYLDIAGHRNGFGGFEDDFIEFQQDFWFATIAPFLTSFELPLTGGLINPAPQRNDIPDALSIRVSP